VEHGWNGSVRAAGNREEIGEVIEICENVQSKVADLVRDGVVDRAAAMEAMIAYGVDRDAAAAALDETVE
jgi:hypothetical protein